LNPLIFTGIAVGFAFGFALQRGRFCMNSAFRDIILMKDRTLLRAVGVAILVAMIGFAIMEKAGVITISPVPFFWGALMVGGFVFGIGMVLAGGCASGVTYRLGEGMIGAMMAVLGLTLVGLMTSKGILHPVVTALRDATTVTLADGSVPTLANLAGVPYHVMALAIAGTVLIVWMILTRRNGNEEKVEAGEQASICDRVFKRGWGWKSAGIIIGVINIIAFYSSASAGRMYPLGICGGYWSTTNTLITGVNQMNWLSVMLLSTILGAFVAAKLAGEFKFRAPPPKTLVQTFFGGTIMGFGAAMGGGCNITHILSGVPQLAVSSILGGAFLVFGCWFMAYFLFIRPMRNL